MNIAVLSDVHANYLALEAVLRHAKAQHAERFWFLGDVVGYGPQPAECVEWLRSLADGDWVLGNHDAMLLGLDIRERWKGDAESQKRAKEENYFAFKELAAVNDDPIAALRLHLDALSATPETDAYWRAAFTQDRLGPKPIAQGAIDYWLVHSSRLSDQQLAPYIYPWSNYLLKTEMQDLRAIHHKGGKPVCQLHGHTHVAYLLTSDSPESTDRPEPICVEPGRPYPLGKCITLANPGSVGQPRNSEPPRDGDVANGDRRACYAMLDTQRQTITFHRVAYDWKRALRLLVDAGYPDGIRWRLSTAQWPNGKDEPNDFWKDCLRWQQEMM